MQQSDTPSSHIQVPAAEIGRKFLYQLLAGLIGRTSGWYLACTFDERGVLFTVTADKETAGRLIGKKGSTADAIRTLLNALGGVHQARYTLKVENKHYQQRN